MNAGRAGAGILALGVAACSLALDTSGLARDDDARDDTTEAGASIITDAGDPEAAPLAPDAAPGAEADAGSPAVAADAFERELATGLGDADVGGTWDAPLWSVTGGRAKTIAQIATSSHAYLPRIALADVDVTVDFAAPELSDGSGAYFYVNLRGYRRANYNMGVRVRPEGTIDLHLKKTIGGDESTLDTVAAFTTAAADATIRLRGVALGTRITVKAWKVGEPEPDWQIAEDARDPAVERALDPYMTLYLSSGATATHPYFADNFSIRAAR